MKEGAGGVGEGEHEDGCTIRMKLFSNYCSNK